LDLFTVLSFAKWQKLVRGVECLDVDLVEKMLHNAAEGVRGISTARLGDKTMLDTLLPAVEAFEATVACGGDLKTSLQSMKEADAGWHGIN